MADGGEIVVLRDYVAAELVDLPAGVLVGIILRHQVERRVIKQTLDRQVMSRCAAERELEAERIENARLRAAMEER